jgi:hypothetical protein
MAFSHYTVTISVIKPGVAPSIFMYCQKTIANFQCHSKKQMFPKCNISQISGKNTKTQKQNTKPQNVTLNRLHGPKALPLKWHENTPFLSR